MRPTSIAIPTTTVKFRSGPGTDHPVIESLPELKPGQVLSILDVSDGWAHLHDPYNAVAGYASAQYLDMRPVTALMMPDLYWCDAHGKPDWSRLVLDARYAGAILKASQGATGRGDPCPETEWFVSNWKALAEAGGESCGQSWFRGCYHFLDFETPAGSTPEAWGQAQAQHFADVVGQAGGLGPADLPPIVDVERAGSACAQPVEVVVATATAWATAVAQALGRRPMLYRRHNDSDWPGLTSHMGCSYLWAKRYSSELGSLTNGWSSAALWQYTDGKSNVPDELPPLNGALRYPYDAPGICVVDTSVVLFGDGSPAAVRELIAASNLLESHDSAT